MSKSYSLYRLNPDGALELQPTTINATMEINGEIVENPTEQQLRSVGFKNMKPAELPDFDEETQLVAEHYEDIGDIIVQSFEIVDKPKGTEEE